MNTRYNFLILSNLTLQVLNKINIDTCNFKYKNFGTKNIFYNFYKNLKKIRKLQNLM